MNKTTRNKHMMSKKLIVSVIAILTLLVGCAGCKKVTPKEALDKALEKTFTDTDPVEKLLDVTAMNEAVANGTPYSSGLSVTLEEVSGALVADTADLLAGIGLSVDTATDLENQKNESSIGISYGGTTYMTMATQFDASKFYLMIPKLLNGSVSIDFATMLDDIASNELYSDSLNGIDASTLESLNYDFWGIMENAMSVDYTLPEELIKKCESLEDSVIVAEVKVEEANLPSDISAKKVYTMTIPKDAYTEVSIDVAKYIVDEMTKALTDESMQDIVTELDMPDEEEITTAVEDIADIIGDIVLTFAVNKDGYVNFAAYELSMEEGLVAYTLKLSGDKSPLEVITLEMTATVDEETVSLKFTQNFDADTKTVTYDGEIFAPEFNATINAEGEYTDIEKGKKYAFDLNYFEFDCSEDFSFTLSGSSYLDTTSCDITTPEGTEYELFKMDENDLTTLMNEVMTNIQNDPLLSELFGLSNLN